MIMDKKEEIMLTAIQFFSEKSYFSTSVQEIAEHCEISKGTFYTYFETKEELLIQVIDYSRLKLFEHTMNLDFESTLSPKEKLIKKIVMQYDVIVENKSFIFMLLGTFIPQNNPRVSELIDKIHITTLNWYKTCLLEAYGDKLDPYTWDFTVILQATIKEYLILAIKEDKHLNSEKTVRFVVDRLETLIDHTKDVKPILTSDKMSEFESFEEDINFISPQEQIHQILKETEKKLYRLSLSKEDYRESVSVIQYLRQELDEKKPRRFIIKSLLLYLKDIEGFEILTKRLEMILKSTYL